MIAGTVCMSHSPLLDRNRAEPEVEAGWNAAVGRARRFVADRGVDLCVMFYPDHLNGFLYNLLPAFCVGMAGQSLGDFGSVPGTLDIPEDAAASLAAHCLASGIDIAQSYDLLVDHGAMQPFEALVDAADGPPLIPVFINCAAAPCPPLSRARALGVAVGTWAAEREERVLIVGSGGLSHDPPLPNIAGAVGEAAKRLRHGGTLSHAARALRQRRTHLEGVALSSGNASVRLLNPEWDRTILDALARGELDCLDAMNDQAITDMAGRGAHELRCWLAALAAQQSTNGGFRAVDRFYAPVSAWLTGMGVLTVAGDDA